MQKPKPPVSAHSDDDNLLSRIDELLFYAQTHKNMLIGAGAFIVIMAAGIFFYNNQKIAQNEKAANAVAKILPTFQGENYDVAIYGDAATMGLLEITQTYTGTDYSDIANLYLGKAFFEKGVYDSALMGFQNVSSGSGITHAIALAGEGACYEEQGQFEKAAGLFKNAAQSTENTILKPLYFSDASRNYELSGNISEAIALQETLLKEFTNSKQGQNAKMEMTRLKSLPTP